jgi:regulator of sirC expression with transglutaminase-like and TPR domain
MSTEFEINKDELKALVSLLDDEDEDVVQHVQQRLVSIGSEAIPFLEERWEQSFEPLLQKRIENIIHRLQFFRLKKRLDSWKEQGSEDLLEGMWLVATYQYPDLEFDYIRKEIEQIYYQAWVDFNENMHPYDQIRMLNQVLFEKLKFGPSSKKFHSPGNSMFNVVLETKKGNPISLCVLYMLVARKLEMPVYGVNLPNLFICTYKKTGLQFYINAYNKGLIFSRLDIDNYIEQLHVNPDDIFYEPCGNLDIVRRVLRNLVLSFEKSGQHSQVEDIRTLLQILS